MKSKEAHKLARAAAAQRLRQVADMIEGGSVQLGNTSLDIPNEVKYELEVEEKKYEGKVELDIEWHLDQSI